MVTEYFGPLPQKELSLDKLGQWLTQQTISAQRIITGSLQAGQEISSANFVAGTSGWQIDGDGNAEFNDVTVRGDIESGNWDGTSPANLASADSGATEGFYLDSSAGAAQFMGNIFIVGGGNVEVVGTSNKTLKMTNVSGVPTLEFYPVSAPDSTGAIFGSGEGVLIFRGGRTTFSTDKMGTFELRGDEFNVAFFAANSAVGVTTFQVTDTDSLLTVPLRIPDGSVSAPSLAFSSNPDIGIFTTGSDIRFALDGVNDFIFGNSTLTIRDGANNPEVRWTDANLGTNRRYSLFRDDADFDSFKLSATDSGGTGRTFMRLVDTSFQIGVSGATTDLLGTVNIGGNTAWHAGNDGSGSGLDADTVDGSHASAFSAVGHGHTIHTLAQHIAIGVAQGGSTIAASANAHYDETSTLRLVRRATSTMFAKRNIMPLRGGSFDIVPEDRQGTLDWSQGDILAVTPALFRSDLPDDDQEKVYLGLIAEDVARHVPEAASYRDGKPDGVEWNAVTALLLDEVRNLRDRVKTLEARV